MEKKRYKLNIQTTYLKVFTTMEVDKTTGIVIDELLKYNTFMGVKGKHIKIAIQPFD